ncbi:hypothetical protein FWC31_02850 [Candidatus Saccharibacteria bacterium]|nr:hypothetical protein [Candidatus Saccharibacteria bacterium]
MNKKIIIIGGHFASGKSTFALRLSKELNIPYLTKDTLKSAICTNIPIRSREESKRFSAVAFNVMMYVVERFLETDHPIIIESNFVPHGVKEIDEAGVIKKLIDKYDYQSLTYKFVGDMQILYKRCMEREKLHQHGEANKLWSDFTYDYFERYCHNLDDFHIDGEIITIDTTDFDKVNFDAHIETARQFILS